MTTLSDPPAGQARSAGPEPQKVLAEEAKTQRVPSALLTESPAYFGVEDLPRERYTSQAVHDLEVEKMWRKVWQMACREEDIPNVGDTISYDIADESIVVVRVADASADDPGIKAYHNTCLHRGTQLVRGKTSVSSLQCQFHGWSWHLDGSLKNIPCRWDFPQVTDEAYALPEVQVGTWDGWVFVNFDPGCGSLEDYLGEVLPAHFKDFPLAERFKAVHVQARVPANWKATMEAFLESYHVFITHPEIINITGDHNTQYDCWGDNANRMITLMGVPSPILEGSVDDQEVVDSFIKDVMSSEQPTEIPDGKTPRDVAADAHRADFADIYGVDLSGMSNAEAIDAVEYALFPNFIPWAGDGFPIVYRFRPDGNDPDHAIADVMLMAPCPPGMRPPAAEIHHLQVPYGEDSPNWEEAPELGILGPILNQDMGNLSRVQRGLHAGRTSGITLSAYQETRIRHFATTLRKYLEA